MKNSTLSTPQEIKNNKKRILQPWERHIDPNPFPSIASLEESTTVAEIDAILDQITSKETGSTTIIQQYKPHAGWLWSQFYGTVIYSAWPRALLHMAYGILFCAWVRFQIHGDFNIFTLETTGEHWIGSVLAIVEKIWSTLMGLTTFLLTFFVGQSWTFWKSFIDISRTIQGRFVTIMMLLASHATRDDKTETMTPEAEGFLKDLGQRLKLFHTLHWASQALRFRALLTKKGWDRMVARGMVTKEERKRLEALKLGPTQKHLGVFQSMFVKTERALKDKAIIGLQNGVLEKKILEEFCTLRGTSGTIAGLVSGRMVLAYVHFVQILVDTFLICTPIAKYKDLGIFAVFLTGILTFFYHGLLVLAKVFLDPLDNEHYKVGCVYLDLAVLLRESNCGIDNWVVATETI